MRVTNSSTAKAVAALLLISLCASASATSIRSPAFFRRSLLANPAAAAPTTSTVYATDNPATLSGLQDAPSVGNTTVVVGHYLTGNGTLASVSYTDVFQYGGQKTSSAFPATGTWGQALSYSAVDSGNGDVSPDIFEDTTFPGVTLSSVKFNQKKNVWMLDTGAGKQDSLCSKPFASLPFIIDSVLLTFTELSEQVICSAIYSHHLVSACYFSELTAYLCVCRYCIQGRLLHRYHYRRFSDKPRYPRPP